MVRYRIEVLALNINGWNSVRGKIGYVSQFNNRDFSYNCNDLQALTFENKKDAEIALRMVKGVVEYKNLPCKVSLEAF